MRVVEEQKLTIRAATSDDADEVRAFLERLSPEGRWLRYHTGVPRVRPWMVDTVVGADGTRHESLLAFSGHSLVGIAEWGRVECDEAVADVGIVVDECCRRRGIARELLRHLGASGRQHGIHRFVASVLSTNRPTIALVQDVAPERDVSFDGPIVSVTIPLRASA